MRKISLINELEYKNKHYDEKIDDKTNLIKTIYETDDLVLLDGDSNNIANNITNGYINLFTKRGLVATDLQKEFAKKTAKILLGKLKDINTIPVIPAPCGFGKSTITQVFLEEICNAYKNNKYEDGLIIVTDKIEQLYELHNSIKDLMGYYKIETKDEREYKTSFTYVLEGWKEDSYERGVCLNKDIKVYEVGMCSEENCPYFGECKISKQKYQQIYSPILLITNARLQTCGESVDMYSTYKDKNGEKKSRTLRINDEKPPMRDTFMVNIKILNEIKNGIYKISDKDKRRLLIDKWTNICNIIEAKFKDYEVYERMLISNVNNSPILLNDIEFTSLWKECIGSKFKNELRHIHTVLTKGGLYCNTKKNSIFINTLGMKNLISENFKTVIFDATALIDQDYSNEDIIRFVDIENPRTFENLTFNFYMANKLNKTEFNNKNYLISACSKFLNTISKENTYIVTYSEKAKIMLREIKNNPNITINKKCLSKVNIITFDEDTLFYFGNTKGSNKAKDCTQMVQFGWNNLPDYEYITRYLSTNYSQEYLNKIFEDCADIDKAEVLIDKLTNKDSDEMRLYKNYSMLTDFVQEIFRTNLRQYDCNNNIIIHCFQCNGILVEMIKQIFHRCNINMIREKLECFKEVKADNRENKGKSYIKFKEWLDKQPKGKIVKVKEILEETEIDRKQLDKLKGTSKTKKGTITNNNTFIREWFNTHKGEKVGTYVI